MIQSVIVDVQDNFINFRYEGDGSIIYTAKLNTFQEDTGLTILNPGFGIPAYVLNLGQYGESLLCGHIIDNVIGYLKNSGLENIVLIVNFNGVTEISESFAEQYMRFLLSTKSKVLSINQNTNIINTFSTYVQSVIDVQEVTE